MQRNQVSGFDRAANSFLISFEGLQFRLTRADTVPAFGGAAVQMLGRELEVFLGSRGSTDPKETALRRTFEVATLARHADVQVLPEALHELRSSYSAWLVEQINQTLDVDSPPAADARPAEAAPVRLDEDELRAWHTRVRVLRGDVLKRLPLGEAALAAANALTELLSNAGSSVPFEIHAAYGQCLELARANLADVSLSPAR